MINISKTAAEAAIPLLTQVLIELIDLRSQAKQAHWNVKGPNFIALHELFERVAVEVAVMSDDVAERIRQLGGLAEGTVDVVAHRTTLPSYPVNVTAEKDHVRLISQALFSVGGRARAAIDGSSQAGDAGTADLFTGVSNGLDKLHWLVSSHME